jgi:hypothetical protein
MREIVEKEAALVSNQQDLYTIDFLTIGFLNFLNDFHRFNYKKSMQIVGIMC